MTTDDAVVAEVWGLIERECLSNLSRKWAEGGGSKTTVALLVELAGEHLRAERKQYLEQTAAWVERELSKLKLNGNAGSHG